MVHGSVDLQCIPCTHLSNVKHHSGLPSNTIHLFRQHMDPEGAVHFAQAAIYSRSSDRCDQRLNHRIILSLYLAYLNGFLDVNYTRNGGSEWNSKSSFCCEQILNRKSSKLSVGYQNVIVYISCCKMAANGRIEIVSVCALNCDFWRRHRSGDNCRRLKERWPNQRAGRCPLPIFWHILRRLHHIHKKTHNITSPGMQSSRECPARRMYMRYPLGFLTAPIYKYHLPTIFLMVTRYFTIWLANGCQIACPG